MDDKPHSVEQVQTELIPPKGDKEVGHTIIALLDQCLHHLWIPQVSMSETEARFSRLSLDGSWIDRTHQLPIGLRQKVGTQMLSDEPSCSGDQCSHRDSLPPAMMLLLN